MATSRDLRLRPAQIVWLVAILVAGITVGIVAGLWWGIAAAVIVLLVSEVVERIQRSRR